jgi:hypothetical protein
MRFPPEVICGTVEIAKTEKAKKVFAYQLVDLAVTPADATCESRVLWTITHVPTGFGLATGAALFRRADDAVAAMFDIYALLGRPLEITIPMLVPRQMQILEICRRRCGVLNGEVAA